MEDNKKEKIKEPRGLYLKIGVLLALGLLLTYGKIIWPSIYGRMRKEDIGFFEAAASEHILVGGLIFLVALVIGAWFWTGRKSKV